MSATIGSRSLLMVSLTRFYSQGDHLRRILPLIRGDSHVSLRLIDWFVTNYSKKHEVVLTQVTSSNNVVHFNVHLSYRAQLKAYSKQQFDPFRRRDRIMFYYDVGEYIETTVGQLNFFRWMLQHGVLQYIEEHAAAIEQEMLLANTSAVEQQSPSGTKEDERAGEGADQRADEDTVMTDAVADDGNSTDAGVVRPGPSRHRGSSGPSCTRPRGGGVRTKPRVEQAAPRGEAQEATATPQQHRVLTTSSTTLLTHVVTAQAPPGHGVPAPHVVRVHGYRVVDFD